MVPSGLRNIGLFVLAGVLVAFSSAVFAMSYISSYMSNYAAANLSNGTKSQLPYNDKLQCVEEAGFEPQYTDKTHLVGQVGPGAEPEVGANSHQIKVNLQLDTSEIGIEDVDF